MSCAPLWLALVLTGCASVQVDGHHMNQESWENDERDIRRRAAFDLTCPPEKLQLVLLATLYPGHSGDVATQVGVTGCEHHLVYVRGGSPSGWVLNSADGQGR